MTTENRDCDITVTGSIGANKRHCVGDRVQLSDSNVKDRISNLPGDLIYSILNCLQLRDLVRTSILSKAWRSIWGMHRILVIDYLVFTQITCKIDEDRHISEFRRAVENLLVAHVGPISTFYLYIPPKLISRVHMWMLDLSKKGIRTLELYNSIQNVLHRISSVLFDFEDLIFLRLTSWRVRPPYKPYKFTSLGHVELINVTILYHISFGTQLKKLKLEYCAGIQYLGSNFTNGNLTELLISDSNEIDWSWFEYTKQLIAFGLLLTTSKYLNPKKSISLNKLLGDIPNITALCINAFTLEALGPVSSILEGLTTKLEKVQWLRLSQLGFCNLCRLSVSVCLIRSLPNLRDLLIVLELEVENLETVELKIERYLESLDWNEILPERLQTVEIHGVVGSRSVLHFIKLLLASSPSLRVMSLYFSNNVNDSEVKFKIKQELHQYPRKSLAARLFVM